MEKKYWQSFGELNETEAFKKSVQNEFKEDLLPLEDLSKEGFAEAKTPRRDFLKYLGFSTAAATLAASCEMPVRKSVPYLNRPDTVIPGVADYYASTYVSEGDVVSVVVKQRDGRPIKIEGNEKSTITVGGTSAQVQASVLDLYDMTRLRNPKENTANGPKEIPTFDRVDKLVADAIAGLAGKPIVLLTSTINSPSTKQIIEEFKAKYPGARHVQYDAASYSGLLLANEATYGKRAIPSYRFDKAKVIVSLGADFLGTWLSPVEFSHQYSKNRKITGDNPDMSRHIQFESNLSMTGSNADDRYPHKPSEKAAVALAILAKLGGGVAAPAIKDANLAKGIDATVAALNANKGAGLVVSGSNDVNLQVIVNAINEIIGANGNTIDWGSTLNYRQGIDADIVNLVTEMKNGAIGGLFVYGTNPVYSYFDSKSFQDGLKKVPLTVSFNGTMDETSELCKYVIPSHHWLESWGDAEPKTGYYSLIQPLINPLFKTRAFQTSLLKWSGNATDYANYFRAYWISKLGSEDTYNLALQDGVIEPGSAKAVVATAPAIATDSTAKAPVAVVPAAATASSVATAFNGAKVGEAAAKLATVKGGEYEVVFYQKISLGTGVQANNPWLQELADPVTKVTWDNYALVGPALAKKLLGIDVLGKQREGDRYEVTPEKPTIKIKVNGKELELPVLIIPGVQADTIAVALGYGRKSVSDKGDLSKTKENIGLTAAGAGQNVFPLVWFDGTVFRYSAPAEVSKTGNVYALAQAQVHGSSEHRPVLFETSLAAFKKDPKALLRETKEELASLLPFGYTVEGEEGAGKDAEVNDSYRKNATIYPHYEKPGIKWGMSIDLSTCTGCSACVVACTAENNVAVVGKTQVIRAHEMHWLRIDRYFTGDMENPDVVFQPMLCQHCDNAPCENVCPVAATNHSSEGLNQMTYNRCIGTRYCANNCPFKVRRFNWLDFTGADSFPDNQNPLMGSDLDPVTIQMNDELTRMVLNPDVTVRSRGVIEKCSFCVQRLQESKLKAKKDQNGEEVRNVQVACSQACASGCITFGNVNDPESEVSKARLDTNRNFYVLETLHVLPNVSYLAKIKNTERHVTNEKEESGAEGHEAKKEEKAHA